MTLVKRENTSAYCKVKLPALCRMWKSQNHCTFVDQICFWNKHLSWVASGCIQPLVRWIGHCSLLPRRECPPLWPLCNFSSRHKNSRLCEISRKHNNSHVSPCSSPKFCTVFMQCFDKFSSNLTFFSKLDRYTDVRYANVRYDNRIERSKPVFRLYRDSILSSNNYRTFNHKNLNYCLGLFINPIGLSWNKKGTYWLSLERK